MKNIKFIILGFIFDLLCFYYIQTENLLISNHILSINLKDLKIRSFDKNFQAKHCIKNKVKKVIDDKF